MEHPQARWSVRRVRSRWLAALAVTAIALAFAAVGVPLTSAHADAPGFTAVEPAAAQFGLPAHGSKLAVSPDGADLYTTSAAGSIMVIDADSRKVVRDITSAT
jgi:streptogramin lyase